MSAIDDYLDRMLGELRGSPETVRRILSETENHLRETAESLEREGSTSADAESEAVARFGSADIVARQFGRVGLRDFLRPGLVLGAVGFLAICMSGLVAEFMGRVWGAGFVAGDISGTSYTPARCADFIGYFPGRTCLEAAAMHHWGEVVQYRVAAGALGLVCLVLLRLVHPRSALPSTFAPIVGTALFGSAAVVLLADAASSALQGGAIGASLSAGAIAAGVAAYFAIGVWGAMRQPLIAR